jgi:hypothetical protein
MIRRAPALAMVFSAMCVHPAVAQPVSRDADGTIKMIVPSGANVDPVTKAATITTTEVVLPVASDVIRLRPAGAPVIGLTPEESAEWIKTNEVVITAEGQYIVQVVQEPPAPLPPERGALHTGEGENPNAVRATIRYAGPWKLDERAPDNWRTVPQWVEKYEDGRECKVIVTRIGPVSEEVTQSVQPTWVRLWTVDEARGFHEGARFRVLSQQGQAELYVRYPDHIVFLSAGDIRVEEGGSNLTAATVGPSVFQPGFTRSVKGSTKIRVDYEPPSNNGLRAPGY